MDELSIFKAVVRTVQSVPMETRAISAALNRVRSLVNVAVPVPPPPIPSDRKGRGTKDRLERFAPDRTEDSAVEAKDED